MERPHRRHAAHPQQTLSTARIAGRDLLKTTAPVSPRSGWRLRGRGARLLAALLATLALLLFVTPVQQARADWTATSTLPGLGNGAIWSVAVSPSDANLVVAGTDNGIYRSADGGSTWKQVAAVGRVWTVGFDLRDAHNVFAGTQGKGVYASADAGVSWASHSAGLLNLNVRSMAFSLSQIAVGTDSGVAVSVDGVTWGRGGLDGVTVSALTVVKNSPQLVLMAGTDTTNSGGFLWTNDGDTWTVDKGTGLPQSASVSSLASGPITAAITQRPIVADTTQGAFRSLDGGATWSPATGLPAVGTSTLVLTTACFSPLDPTVLYSGADAGGSPGGGMMHSVDSGLSYSDFSGGLPNNAKDVTSITVAPTSPPTVYLATAVHNSPSHVWRIIDTGAPAPPQLVPETPGGQIPVIVGTPTPTPKPKASATATPKPSSSSSFLGKVFHWPTPLVYELIVLLLLIWGFIWWRQRAYVEGPP